MLCRDRLLSVNFVHVQHTIFSALLLRASFLRQQAFNVVCEHVLSSYLCACSRMTKPRRYFRGLDTSAQNTSKHCSGRTFEHVCAHAYDSRPCYVLIWR